MEQIIQVLNNDKAFAGLIAILMNIGGKHLYSEIPQTVDVIFQNVWLKRLIIFGIAFISTRDIKIALLITVLFVIVFNHLINDKSQFCLLPENFKNINQISEIEYKKALDVVNKYQQNKTT